MWEWLIWRPNSEILKIQKFGRGSWVGQNDHYFRSYMTQKTSVILYELLYAWVFWHKRSVKWSSCDPDSKTLSNSNSGCGRLLFSSHHYLRPYFKRVVGKNTYNVFSILKETFVMVLTLIVNFLSWYFDKVKIVKCRG